LLSTLTFSSHLPSRQIFWIRRAVLSLPPPGDDSTTNSTGLSGFHGVCAAQGAAAAMPSTISSVTAAPAALRGFIYWSPAA
jgi:hypothetical protein